MSCIDWLRAEVELPSGEVAGMKQALRDATNRLHTQARAAADDFWTNHAKRTRSTKLYDERLEAYLRAEESTGGYWKTATHVSGFEYPATENLRWMLQSVSAHPHKLTEAEIDKFFPRATGRTTVFGFSGGAANIDGRKLTWGVSENNHAVERAEEHPVYQAMQMKLNKVTWTRGSGGHAWGSDEYAQDVARENGGNPISIRGQWGPLGERAARAQFDPMGELLARSRRRRRITVKR